MPGVCGDWVTANARYRLEEGLRLAGEGAIYTDTDSVKYIGEVDWGPYNKKRMDASKRSGAYATDPAGVTHYMGVYEHDESYKEFITLGAKKYAGRVGDDIFITIAGVRKKDGAKELEAAGGLTAFKEGFTFYDAGGTESVYNDDPEITSYMVDGKRIPITSNLVIRPSTYTLGITADYMRLLQHPEIF